MKKATNGLVAGRCWFGWVGFWDLKLGFRCWSLGCCRDLVDVCVSFVLLLILFFWKGKKGY